ncbi:unnamed protein product [Prunus brigantina]
MILGSQMELSEIEELPKKLLREEAGRAFRLQASISLFIFFLSFGIADIRLLFSGFDDMWLCVKRAITAAEKAKKAYEDGGAKVAEAGKAIQVNANLAKDLQAAERQVKCYEAKFAEMSAALESAQQTAKEALEAKEAVQVALEETEQTKASEIEAAVRGYRRSAEFSNLLDSEVGEEMAGLVYQFKRYNPGKKLNLNFIADPPPLPEGITEEMIDEYEGEVTPESDAEEPVANATGGGAAAAEEETSTPAEEEAA